MELEQAIAGRRSVRAFLPQPVPQSTVARILEIASRAPSGTNIQPWKVHVLAGERRAALTRAILDVREAEGPDYKGRGTARKWEEPYISRRRKIGWDLYGLLGIERGDKPAMWRQHGRNYEFFGAPVGLMFVIERDFHAASWLDLGMFMQNVMLAARQEGLDTCPQGAFLHYEDVVSEFLDLPETDALASGMSLGYADNNAPENALTTEREKVEDFASFNGF